MVVAPEARVEYFSGIDSKTDPFTDFCHIPFYPLLTNHHIQYSSSIYIYRVIVGLVITS
jgi:hypothetical protein